MTHYETTSGNILNLENLDPRAAEIIPILKREYGLAESWISLQNRTSHMCIEVSRQIAGDKWSEYPIYRIQRDLVVNKGIEREELVGERSRMFIDE